MHLRHPFARPEAASHRGRRAPQPRDTLTERNYSSPGHRDRFEDDRGGEGGGCHCEAWLCCGAVVAAANAAVALLHRVPQIFRDSPFPKSRKPRWRRATHTAPILPGRNPAPPYRRDSPSASSQYWINQIILALDEPIWGRVNSWTNPGARRFPGPIGVPTLLRTGTPGLVH